MDQPGIPQYYHCPLCGNPRPLEDLAPVMIDAHLFGVCGRCYDALARGESPGESSPTKEREPMGFHVVKRRGIITEDDHHDAIGEVVP